MAETLTALYQRNKMVWVGVSMFVLGLAIPETPLFWGIELSRTVHVGGGGILITGIVVAVFRTLKST